MKFIALIALSALTACTSFRGPGDYQPQAGMKRETPQAFNETNDEVGPGPKISWSGERRYSKKEDEFQFDWPLDQARLSRGFQIGGKKSHWGLDLANKKNTEILAAEKGKVIYTGKGFHGYGNLIVIEHGSEWATLYAHLNTITVKEGDEVKRGEVIGMMGNTGRSSGTHLHFEMRHNRQPVNPMAYLPEGF